MDAGLDTTPRTEYPAAGLQPRADTQAAEFVRKYPEYDGRGVVVAVLDTGIDAGAKGLQTTSTGQRKVVDYVDCTGAGDVGLQDVEATDNTVRGASGRTLRLNAAWTNPTGVWRVGSKRLYDLVPADVRARMVAERDGRFSKRAAAVRDAARAGSGEESEARAAAAAALEAAYVDGGSVVDCVVFHDGSQWRAALDTDGSGDLTQAEALGAYKRTGDVGLLSRRQLFYYTLNFYDEGRTLSIVTCAGSHGTHVAGIVAAWHADDAAACGVAPGAQLVSLTIGDHRAGSMETGTGLARAAAAIVEHGARVANMSYGEPSATPNAGQWVQAVAQEVVRRHGCAFVASAGNEGPALTTLGAPGGTTSGIISVGAYVGLEQMAAEYGMYARVRDGVFTWSSRGPTADGARGVDVYAPGSAVTSFPAYTRERRHLSNGTSMSAPSLSGVLALLASAWLRELPDARLTPHRLRAAITRTAKPISDAHGAGLVQTDAAWQFLKAQAARAAEDVAYSVRVDDTRGMRGIYLRNAEDSARVRFFKVAVTPVFPTAADARLEDDADGSRGQQESQAQFDFEQRVLLVARAPWLAVPESLYVGSAGAPFSVRVDATQLEPGRLHTASIDAYDSRNVDRGPIFSVPVTVTKPLDVGAAAAADLGTLSFGPADIVRRFIAVPRGATSVEIVVRTPNTLPQDAAPALFYVHCVQLVPDTRFKRHHVRQRIDLGHKSYGAEGGASEQKHVVTLAVVGGATLEVCLAQFWSQLDRHDLHVRMSFAGLVPVAGAGAELADAGALEPGLVLHAAHAVVRADFAAPMRAEHGIKPAATLNALRRALRPHTSRVAPLQGERDTCLATGQAMYALDLEYRLDTWADSAEVRLRLPAVDTQIYEAWAEDFALSVFDANKRRLATQIGYTDKITLRLRGDYLVRVRIRHRRAKDLDALKDVPLLAEFKLPTPVTVATKFDLASVFTTTVANSGAYRGEFVPRGGRFAVFFDVLGAKLPTDAKPGDVLCGSLSLNGRSSNLALELVVPPAKIEQPKTEQPKTEQPKAEQSEKAPSKSDVDQLEEALRKVRLDHIAKATDAAVRTRLIDELLASSSTDEQRAEVLHAQLNALDPARESALPWADSARLGEPAARTAVAVADQLIALTRAPALTARLFEKSAQSAAEKEQKKHADGARTQLIAALTTKCRALSQLARDDATSEESAELVDHDDEGSEPVASRYEQAAQELRQWGDAAAPAALMALVPLQIAQKQYGRALQPVLAWLGKAPLTAANAAQRAAMADLRDVLLEKLEWTAWSDYFREMAPITHPADYEPL
ncbi:hypothetical protein H4S02_004202 [Coemansia sp. RSA 2611]|nr:hypothetical protein H4S02_004202 [Coemansia sp. RSA 2611]